MPNRKLSPEKRLTGISITIPPWMIDEIDRRSGESGRSKVIVQMLYDALSRGGNEAALGLRLREVELELDRLEQEKEHLSEMFSVVSSQTKKLDDPLVQEAIVVITQRAANYKSNEGEEMQDRAIRNMAEKYLKGPMPQGFIERVRANGHV